MNKKGFTLIEVIMVIAIIALLSLILIPNVLVLIDKNNEESLKNLENNILSAAKMYVANNKYELNFNCNEIKQIKIKDLDLNGNIKNPKTDQNIKKEASYIDVKYDCSNKTFSYDLHLIWE